MKKLIIPNKCPQCKFDRISDLWCQLYSRDITCKQAFGVTKKPRWCKILTLFCPETLQELTLLASVATSYEPL